MTLSETYRDVAGRHNCCVMTQTEHRLPKNGEGASKRHKEDIFFLFYSNSILSSHKPRAERTQGGIRGGGGGEVGGGEEEMLHGAVTATEP